MDEDWSVDYGRYMYMNTVPKVIYKSALGDVYDTAEI